MVTPVEEAAVVSFDRGSIQQSAKLLVALGEARDKAQPPEKDRTFLKRDRDGSSKLVLYPSPGSYGAEWRRATKGLGLHVLPMREEVRQVQGPLHSLRREFLVAHSSGESFAMWREGFFAPGPDFPLDKALSAAQAALLGNVFRELLAIAPTGEDLADEPRVDGEARHYGPPKREAAPSVEVAEWSVTVRPAGRETVEVPPPKRPGQFHSGVSRAPVPSVEGPATGLPVVEAPDDLFDEKPKNNATTAPGEASSPGEKGDSSAGQASRPVEDLPAKGSVVAPSQVQSEGEATPQPPAPQVDGRSPDQQVSPSAGLFLNCVECQRGLTVSDEAFVDENDDGPYCAACWKARPVTKGTSVEPAQGRVLYPIEPNKDGFTDECPECDSVIQGVPSDDLIHDGARLFCEKGHELGVTIRGGKARVQVVLGGPTVDIESRESAASGPSEGTTPKEGLEGQAKCDSCGKVCKDNRGLSAHKRKCQPREGPSEPQGKERDLRKNPEKGDAPKFLGITYEVLHVEGSKLQIRKVSSPGGVQSVVDEPWSLARWRAFWKKRTPDPANVSLVKESDNVVSEGLAPIATWKDESL